MKRLVEILRNQGIYGIEELTKLLAQTIQGYANQLQIEPLRKEEIEYIWQKLMD